jgi:hypothetical protein
MKEHCGDCFKTYNPVSYKKEIDEYGAETEVREV